MATQTTLIGIVGEFSRYAIYEVTARRDGCSSASDYLVEDAETPDETGLPSVVRQGASIVEVLDGLCEPHEIARLLCA